MKTFIKLLIFGWFLLLVISSHAQRPSIGGFNVYYGHLHNHSNVSDGTNTPDAAYNYARNTAKLDFFSLADHSSAIEATEWSAIKAAVDKYNLDGVFTAFRGFEWTENVLGHVAVINSENYISIVSPTNTFAGFCNWLNDNECVAFFNHPGRNNSTGLEFGHFATTPTDKIVGMELWNKTDRFPVYYYTDGYYANDGNKSWFDEAIERGWKIGASGSEDNHSGTWGTATPSKLAVLAAANTQTDIYNALKAKRFFTTYDLNLALSFKIGGNEMGSIISAGTLSFNILASDVDNELFTQVQLLKNGSVIQTWTPNVSTVNISGEMTFATGEYYYIRVKQADNDEAISSPIWIGQVNRSPSTSITSPVPNANFVAPASVTISATASDPDGSIQKVEFYQGSNKIGEDSSSPYSINWTGVSAGNYSLTAKAIDNMGASGVSTSIPILVTNSGSPVTSSSIIATGMDDVEESSTGNILANVNSTDIELVYDASTSAGTQVVGLRFVNMNIPQGAVISNAYIQFTCDEVSSGACNLTISGEDVDNSVAFTTADFNVSGRTKTTAQVNWIPAAWSTVNESGINQRTPDISTVIQEIVSRSGYVSTSAISLIINGTGSRIADSYNGSPSQAAVLHVTYNLPLENQPPLVSITSPANGTILTAPATINLSSAASDTDGTITKVEYFNGATLIGTGTGSGYALTWSNVSAGNYSITAKATDNEGALTVSSAVNVVVNASNQMPFVSITSPLNGTKFTTPASFAITASATDPDGSISKVDFYQGTTFLGSDSSNPYSYTWTSVTEGSYSLKAVATDNLGATATSVVASITVDAAAVPLVFTNRISSGNDDAEESSKGAVVLNGDDIELVYDTKTTGSQVVGLRFNSVSVPQGSVISKAYIQFTVDEKTNAGCNLTIKGENIDNALTFSATNNNVSGRIRTVATVNWVPSGWTTVGLAGVAQQTPDLKSIVQEIVNRSAWGAGNSMAFILTGTGNGKRTAVSYDSTPTKAAMLYIEYQAPSSSSMSLKVGKISSATSELITEDRLANLKPELVCYPIPFTDVLNIELQTDENDKIVSIEVFNSNGTVLKSLSSSGVKTQVQLPGLPSGIYFVRVTTLTKAFQCKVVKN